MNTFKQAKNAPNEPLELISAIAELVEQLKRPQIPVDDLLWSYREIADYLRLSQDAVARNVVAQPNFPQPLLPCTKGKKASKRWFAGEVIRWAKNNRSAIPIAKPRRNQSKRAATSEAVAL